MQFLAAATKSASERAGGIPMDVWLKLGVGIGALILAVVVLRKLAKVNKVVLTVVVLLVLSFVGFNWIYERNEPAWATPVVQWLAGFLPTKGMAHK
jgi:hypothetical protein